MCLKEDQYHVDVLLLAQAVVEKHADALFRASPAAAFGVRVQALALMLQLLTAQSAASDRFYRCAARSRACLRALPGLCLAR